MGKVDLYDNVSEALNKISIVRKGIEGPLDELTNEEFEGLCYVLNDVIDLLKEGLQAADKELAQWRSKNGIVLNCING